MAKWKVPSPCIDVCKFKKGHCIACGMTKDQESQFKALDGKAMKLEFLAAVVDQLKARGGYEFWEISYRQKCKRKDIDCPLDRLAEAEE